MNLSSVLKAGKKILVDDFFGLMWGRKIASQYGFAEYDGALPAQYTANGSALADYRIYGAAGGAGDRTENLFDIKTAVMGEYWIDDARDTFTYYAGSKCYFIPALANTSYTVTDFTEILPSGVFVFRAAFTNDIPTAHASNVGTTYLKQRINSAGGSKHTATLTNVNYAYLAVQVTAAIGINNNVVISESSTATAEYIPYGYEVDMSVSDGSTATTTPVYIGDTPLGEDEYVSFKEQKIYRMSGGVLTPTDPPVPLPALPTVDGVTITDYAGQSAAVPSRFYAKYRKG